MRRVADDDRKLNVLFPGQIHVAGSGAGRKRWINNPVAVMTKRLASQMKSGVRAGVTHWNPNGTRLANSS
jgi:hypothetical protein